MVGSRAGWRRWGCELAAALALTLAGVAPSQAGGAPGAEARSPARAGSLETSTSPWVATTQAPSPPPPTDYDPERRIVDAVPDAVQPLSGASAPTPGGAAAAGSTSADPLLKLGAGDSVSVQVYGRPEMSTTTYVTDAGTIPVPLAGAVAVAGLSPAQAAQRVAQALRDGQFLVDPQVTITLAQYKSQQVSVLGEVHTPGRYPIESRTTVLDLLAQAGGTNENGADFVYLMRPDGHGNIARYPIDLKGLSATEDAPLPTLLVKGGDKIYVPRADHFYVYGEVQQPNMYRLETGMMVMQAISRGGGVTQRGSDRRIEIERRSADGKLLTLDAHPTDLVQPNDVIRVKERIF